MHGVGANSVRVKFPIFAVLVDVSDIFYFFLFGGGEGGVQGDSEGGVSVFIENPRRGGGGLPGRAGGEWARRVSAGKWAPSSKLQSFALSSRRGRGKKKEAKRRKAKKNEK